MRQTTLILLFLFLQTACLSAQADTVGVEEDYMSLAERLAAYGRLTSRWEIDSMLLYAHPAIFEIVPRQTMAAALEDASGDEDMKVFISDFTVKTIGEIVNEDGIEYCPVTYSNKMTVQMRSEEYRDPEFLADLADQLGGRFTIDTSRYRLSGLRDKMLFAVREGKESPWYFIEYQPDNTSMVDMLVPLSVRERCKLPE